MSTVIAVAFVIAVVPTQSEMNRTMRQVRSVQMLQKAAATHASLLQGQQRIHASVVRFCATLDRKIAEAKMAGDKETVARLSAIRATIAKQHGIP